MWSRLKDAVLGAAEQAGIELPDLPVDLGALTGAALGEAAPGAADSVEGLVTEGVAPSADPAGAPSPDGPPAPEPPTGADASRATG